MKANHKTFNAVADLVEQGYSPSRAAKALRMSPDTVSRWRQEIPVFAEMIDQAESRFIGRMTKCIADAAPDDWRAAAELLARRFPDEFSRDPQSPSRQAAVPFRDRHVELVEVASTPSGREMLLKAGLVTEEWLVKYLPSANPRRPLITDKPAETNEPPAQDQ